MQGTSSRVLSTPVRSMPRVAVVGGGNVPWIRAYRSAHGGQKRLHIIIDARCKSCLRAMRG